MFCKKCGAQLENGSAFCSKCGAAVVENSTTEEKIEEGVEKFQKTVDKEFDGAINDVKETLNRSNSDNSVDRKLRTDRGLLGYIVLSIITCGIYGFFFIYSLAQDVNVACEGDGDTTPGLGSYILFSIITCGIYSLYWEYKLGNRLATNAVRYNLSFQENGTSVLMWRIFGMLLCFVGSYVGIHILLKNANAVCAAYNKEKGFI